MTEETEHRELEQELTPEEIQHLEKLKAVVETALADGVLKIALSFSVKRLSLSCTQEFALHIQN